MALLEDQRLVELQRERRDLAFAVGDIYLGRVKKVMPGLNAAFVDVGYKKDAFLHYLDLGMIYQAQQRFLEQIEKTKAVYTDIPASIARIDIVIISVTIVTPVFFFIFPSNL